MRDPYGTGTMPSISMAHMEQALCTDLVFEGGKGIRGHGNKDIAECETRMEQAQRRVSAWPTWSRPYAPMSS